MTCVSKLRREIGGMAILSRVYIVKTAPGGPTENRVGLTEALNMM